MALGAANDGCSALFLFQRVPEHPSVGVPSFFLSFYITSSQVILAHLCSIFNNTEHTLRQNMSAVNCSSLSPWSRGGNFAGHSSPLVTHLHQTTALFSSWPREFQFGLAIDGQIVTVRMSSSSRLYACMGGRSIDFVRADIFQVILAMKSLVA